MKKVALVLGSIFASVMHSQVGINTTTPGTMLDVNGAITNRETIVTIVSNTAAVPADVSQIQLSGPATKEVEITAPDAPNSGQRLIVFNNTTGGFGAVLNSTTIPNGKALEFVFSNSGWRSTDGGASGMASINIYNSNGTLTDNRSVMQGANTLAFTGTQTNSFSVDGSTFSIDAANDRVGIGTITPDTKLTINTPDNTFGLKHTNGIIDLVSYIGSGAAWLGTTTAHSLNLETNNSSRMTISPIGNVGINQIDPQRPLDVSAAAKPIRLSNLAGTNVGANVLTIDNAGDVRNIPFNNLLAGPVSLTFVASNNLNYTATGDESVIWCAYDGISINLPVPAEAQIGKTITIVSALNAVTMTGETPTVTNAVRLTTIPQYKRMSIFAIAKNVFGNATNTWVVAAKDF